MCDKALRKSPGTAPDDVRSPRATSADPSDPSLLWRRLVWTPARLLLGGWNRIRLALGTKINHRYTKRQKHPKQTSSAIMSLSFTSCERETEDVRWYSTNSLRLLNLTTQRKNLPWASLSTLKCWTPSEHLQTSNGDSAFGPGLSRKLR